MRQKKSEGKSLYSPPPLIYNFFRYRKLSGTQHRRVPLRFFFGTETKTFSQKIVLLPSFPPPLLSSSIIFFHTGNFVKRRSPYEIFRHSDKNFPTDNRDTFLHKEQKSVMDVMFVKTLKTFITVFNRLQKLIKIFVVGRKICRC